MGKDVEILRNRRKECGGLEGGREGRGGIGGRYEYVEELREVM